MAEHSMSKLLWTWTFLVLALALTTSGATVASPDGGSSVGSNTRGPSGVAATSTTGVTSLGDLYRRQARDGSSRRDYRCLNCPNTDERARYFDQSHYYYRQAPYESSGGRPDRYDRNWYYQPEYYEDRARYSGDRGYESSRNRYDDRSGYGGTRYDEERDYVRRPSYHYGSPQYNQDSRYNDYRGNGYDNRYSQSYYGSVRYGSDQYMRGDPAAAYDNRYPDERDYDRGGDYGRGYGSSNNNYNRVRDRDSINGNRDYFNYNYNTYANNNNNQRGGEYGSSAGAYAGRGGNSGGGGGYYRGGASDYYDGAYPSGNRFQGYDNRNFKPWDESYRGTSGFDNSGRGYYFANRRPTSNARPDVDSQSFQVSSHYFVPTTHNSSPSATSSTSSSSSSSSDASSGPLTVSATSAHHSGGSTIGSGSASPAGSGSGYGGVGRYADRNRDAFRSDKDLQSTAYGVPVAVRHRPQGSYLFERGHEETAAQHDGATDEANGNGKPEAAAMVMDAGTMGAGSISESAATRLTDDNNHQSAGETGESAKQ